MRPNLSITPFYEENVTPSEFIPSEPSLNVALQNNAVDNMEYNGVKIEELRDNPQFDQKLSGFDKYAAMQKEQLKNVASLAEQAKIISAQNKQIQQPKF